MRQTIKGLLAAMVMLAAFQLAAEPVACPNPRPDDTCPVCGMFVANFPEWVASVVYQDGHVHHFDGAKDLFKYLRDLDRWAPGHKAADIVTIGVTEYYSLSRIDARKAWYVVGSDVLGPMGHELVPLEKQSDAQEFSDDHQGKRIVRFDEVTPAMLEQLDQGAF